MEDKDFVLFFKDIKVPIACRDITLKNVDILVASHTEILKVTRNLVEIFATNGMSSTEAMNTIRYLNEQAANKARILFCPSTSSTNLYFERRKQQ